MSEFLNVPGRRVAEYLVSGSARLRITLRPTSAGQPPQRVHSANPCDRPDVEIKTVAALKSLEQYQQQKTPPAGTLQRNKFLFAEGTAVGRSLASGFHRDLISGELYTMATSAVRLYEKRGVTARKAVQPFPLVNARILSEPAAIMFPGDIVSITSSMETSSIPVIQHRNYTNFENLRITGCQRLRPGLMVISAEVQILVAAPSSQRCRGESSFCIRTELNSAANKKSPAH